MRFPEEWRRILKEVRKKNSMSLSRSRSVPDGMTTVSMPLKSPGSQRTAEWMPLRFIRGQGLSGFMAGRIGRLIGEVKRAIRIPVIGNGDVTTPYLVKRMLEETGCDGVMIGKGALGNPWIFDPGNRWTIEKGTAIPPSLEERKRVIERHYALLQGLLWRSGSSQRGPKTCRLVYQGTSKERLLSVHDLRGQGERNSCLRPSIPILIRLRGGDGMPICRVGEKGNKLLGLSKKGWLQRRDGRTILFIHGAGGGQLSWSFQKGFFEKEFNPIIIELPGSRRVRRRRRGGDWEICRACPLLSEEPWIFSSSFWWAIPWAEPLSRPWR